MGIYTELQYSAEIAIPEEVKEVLLYMLDGRQKQPERLPDHDLFKTVNWARMFQSDSYYFVGDTHSTLMWDVIGECYYLNIRRNLKTSCSEVELFIDWMNKYVRACETFLGSYRKEGKGEPVLIYRKETMGEEDG